MKSIEWAAGLYEGEGCFTLFTRYFNGKPYRYPTIKISMTDLDVLEAFREVVSLGKIFGPYDYNGIDNKLIWEYRTSKVEETKAVISILYPHLFERRRKQIRSILDECDKWE